MRQGDRQRVAGAANAWLAAAVRQASRVLNGILDEGQELEFMLFATALNNAARGAQAVLGPEHSAVVAYKKAVPDGKHIRNMLEHFDKYMLGEGRLQTPLTEDGARAPWTLLEAGSTTFEADGAEYSVTALTKVGPMAETRSFVLDVRPAIHACGTLVGAAISEAGITRPSEAVEDAMRMGGRTSG